MAHERKRHIIDIVRRRAKLWPILGILGPRQSGKSTLLRNQLRHGAYVTFDSPSIRASAERSPELFVREALGDERRLTIDEIQKVPDLFDTLKFLVDADRRPGMFLISGSTQFSNRVGIRESLTGRIGLQRLFPLTAAECHGLGFHRPLVDLGAGKSPRHSGLSVLDVLKCARSGGMPGHCFLRSPGERREYLRGWIETTCYRDSVQFRSLHPKPELLEKLYRHIAINPFQDATSIGAALHESPRKLNTQLIVLEELFAIARMEPSSLGSGKSRYFLTDSGFASTMGCLDLDVIRLWLANEIGAQYAYAGDDVPHLEYFKSKNGSVIDFVLPDQKLAIIVSDEERVHEYTLRAAKAFAARQKSWRVIVVNPGAMSMTVAERVRIIPWSHCC